MYSQHQRLNRGSQPPRCSSPLPHLNRHHVEAQGLLYHLHEDVVFYLGVHLHETHQAEYHDAEHLVHQLDLDPVVGRVLLRDVVRQAVHRLARGTHVKDVLRSILTTILSCMSVINDRINN